MKGQEEGHSQRYWLYTHGRKPGTSGEARRDERDLLSFLFILESEDSRGV